MTNLKELKDIDYRNILIEINDIQETEDQDTVWQMINDDYKYAKYWSNNWRKLHGLPLRRKPFTGVKFYTIGRLLSVEATKEYREMSERIQKYVESL